MQLSQEIPLLAVINLAGANISDGSWTEARKREILESRQHTSEDLCQALAALPQPPGVLLSASAMGYYGDTGASIADESSPAGDDFLAGIARHWEAATRAAEEAGIRTVHMRLGLVLSREGGILANFILPLGLAAVGRVGSGRQYMSWISLPDVVQIVMTLLTDEEVSGPINLVSEQAVQNHEFSRCLAATLGRPRLPPLPAFVVRLMFGEMADGALLVSNRVQSLRLPELGIKLQHPDLASAAGGSQARAVSRGNTPPTEVKPRLFQRPGRLYKQQRQEYHTASYKSWGIATGSTIP